MRQQRTIKKAVVLEGRGVHSGGHVKVNIKPAPFGRGVVFIRTDIKGRPSIPARPATLAKDLKKYRCTVIESEGAQVMAAEHLLAALGCLAIDNADIEIDNSELPAMDGSALSFVQQLAEAGIDEQRAQKSELALKEPVFCSQKMSSIMALPADNLVISYLLEYPPEQRLTQCASFTLGGHGGDFVREIAPARTFCVESEVRGMLEEGLAKGGDYKNTLVLREGRPLDNDLRFENEPARHKILDIMGDLWLLGKDLKAHIVGIKSGHSLNAELVKRLSQNAEG